MCKCVLYFCHRVTTQLQLTNIYHILGVFAPCNWSSSNISYFFTVPALIIHAHQISLPDHRVPQINQLCCLTYNFDEVLKLALKINEVSTLVSCEAANKRWLNKELLALGKEAHCDKREQ